jgi:PAS domain S-box-containing protein
MTGKSSSETMKTGGGARSAGNRRIALLFGWALAITALAGLATLRLDQLERERLDFADGSQSRTEAWQASDARLVPWRLFGGLTVLFVGLSSFAVAAFAVRKAGASEALDRSGWRLSQESERLRSFLRQARDGIHILDLDGNLVDASDSFCQALGYTRNELVGRHVSTWDAKFAPGDLAEFVAELFAQPVTPTFETRHRRKDGSAFDVEVSGCTLEMDGRLVLFHAARDLTESNLARQTMKLLEKRYSDIYEKLLRGGAT